MPKGIFIIHFILHLISGIVNVYLGFGHASFKLRVSHLLSYVEWDRSETVDLGRWVLALKRRTY